jgi:hypothetical protein
MSIARPAQSMMRYPLRNELKKHMLIATAIGTVASGLWYIFVSRPRKAAYARFHE